MSIPGRVITIRLRHDLAQKLDRLHGEYGAVQMSVLIRLVFSALLQRPFDEQVRVIAKELRRPRPEILP